MHIAVLPRERARAAAIYAMCTAHCAQRPARIKVPTRIALVGALPRNAVGKVDKPALRRAPVPAG